MQNPYDTSFQSLIDSGQPKDVGVRAVAEDYLDGKPHKRGQKNITWSERDAAFWSGGFLDNVPVDAWQSDVLVLALARYLAQDRVANFSLLERIALAVPEVLRRAVRYSRLVLSPRSPRRAEIDRISDSNPEIRELCRILDIFERAHQERVAGVERWQAALSALSPLELMMYASLYAYEHLIPPQFEVSERPDGFNAWMECAWDAINDLFIWKLKTAPENSVKPSVDDIGRSFATHLSPFLFPVPSGPLARDDLYAAFAGLLDAQIELNSFMSQSVDAFCFDDAIRFVRRGDRLEIEELDRSARAAWRRDGQKLARLHGYWLCRALDEFVETGMAAQQIGRRENHEANRLAYIRAIRTKLQLTEVYGVRDTVTNESGERTSLFPALLSLELSSAFYQRDFLETYMGHLRASGDWLFALGRLAWEGLVEGMQNRFPLSWAGRAAKIDAIVGWTVSSELPRGSHRLAASILDFWTSDWARLSARLRKDEAGLHPELFERPFLKLGQSLFELPWIFGLQNNTTAAINNLRRLGARRGELGEETRRIEQRLGSCFEQRRFRIAINWHPPVAQFGWAGEVDLICALDGVVIVIEVKSSFLRRSQRDAWRHGTTTLRRAGEQLRRKVLAVTQSIAEEGELASQLGLERESQVSQIHGWIVDTSIEHDHRRFDGFLKVSLEEVLIALRDDRHLFDDSAWLFNGSADNAQAGTIHQARTLYPQQFSGARFVQVIEDELVWDEVVR
jgi:hypothetical protein